jgi:hypothetical protein
VLYGQRWRQRKSHRYPSNIEERKLHAALRTIGRTGASDAEMPTAPRGGRRNDGVGAPSSNAASSGHCANTSGSGLLLSSSVTQIVVRVESRCGAVALGSAYLLAASFDWRCLTVRTLTPFPHPAHRTEHAICPHSALGQALMLSPTVGRVCEAPVEPAPIPHRAIGRGSANTPCSRLCVSCTTTDVAGGRHSGSPV